MDETDEWVDLDGTSRAVNEQTADGAAVGVGMITDIFIGIAMLILVIVYRIVRRRIDGPPQINLGRRRMRIGAHEFAFDDIVGARLVPMPAPFGKTWNDLTIVLDRSKRVGLAVPLRRGEDVVIPETTQGALLAVIEHSSIEIPRDRYDPKSKFARSGFPTNITRAEATEIVAEPPQPGGALPGVWG